MMRAFFKHSSTTMIGKYKYSNIDKLSLRCFSSFTLKPTKRIVHARSTLDLGCIDYTKGWAWQYYLLNSRLIHRRRQRHHHHHHGSSSDSSIEELGFEKDYDTILFFEHFPVYTLGRGSDENHFTFLKESNDDDDENDPQRNMRERLSRKNRGPGSARLAVDSTLWFEQEILPHEESDAIAILSNIATPVFYPNNGAPIFRVERGGEVTFHGPGQLVVYPLFDLQREPFQKDLHWFLRMLEEAILMTLQRYGIEGTRDAINSGVWVGNDKIAAIGVSSSRWISNHGFAINVSPDLSYFDTSHILPCGIEGRSVTSIAKVLDERGEINKPSVQDVAKDIMQSMEHVFDIDIDMHQPLV